MRFATIPTEATVIWMRVTTSKGGVSAAAGGGSAAEVGAVAPEEGRVRPGPSVLSSMLDLGLRFLCGSCGSGESLCFQW